MTIEYVIALLLCTGDDCQLVRVAPATAYSSYEACRQASERSSDRIAQSARQHRDQGRQTEVICLRDLTPAADKPDKPHAQEQAACPADEPQSPAMRGPTPGASRSALAEGGSGKSTEPAPQPAAPDTQVAGLNLPHGSIMERYNAALGMLADGRLREGEAALKSLIADFPSDPMVANARYRLGDLYFGEHDYARAVDELQSAYEQDRSSPSAPRALLEVAASSAYLGDRAAACSQLRSLEKSYRGIVEGLGQEISEARKEFKCR